MNLKYPLIVGSSSPRRQYLMKEAGFEFSVIKPEVDEEFPKDLPVEQVPEFLSEKKAAYFKTRIDREIVLTADTVVILNNQILNKPSDENEAKQMLSSLSNETHSVITGVTLISSDREVSFHDTTLVTFEKLSPEEIDFYIRKYSPYDKAGGYGAQDWIGMIAIKKIVGSYFNVMGLPIHKVYKELTVWT